ncbi:MAG: type III-A CRISPR-associated protein Csm2 [Roseiflexaceae bacterium]|nr:type III-A CRISPR-associated protein Csm2 [Roseiflexaceae bacterium]
MTNNREEGTVKNFDTERGFGFIARRSGADLYFNQSALLQSRIDAIQAGDRLSFVVRQTSEGKYRAEQLQLVSRGSAPPVQPIARPSTQTDFRIDQNYLADGYFYTQNDKEYLRPELVDSQAIDVAKLLGNHDMKSNQLRRFFGKVRGIEANLDRNNDFEAVKTDIQGLKRDVAYQVGRKMVPEVFKQFIDRNVDLAVADSKSFRRGFLQHFESVIAYFVYHFRDK